MTDILKEKQFYETWIISVLPLLAVSSTLKNGIIISVITALALLLSSLGAFALKSFLTEKPPPLPAFLFRWEWLA